MLWGAVRVIWSEHASIEVAVVIGPCVGNPLRQPTQRVYELTWDTPWLESTRNHKRVGVAVYAGDGAQPRERAAHN